jgi:hypothetical protein
MAKRKTAGELAIKASSDTTKYDSLEVGHAMTDDIGQQLELCIKAHNPIFDEEEYCLCYVLATDPLIKGVMRRKFFAYPFLPSPRPNQTVFLYNKTKDQIIKRLWVLPHVLAMETLYETPHVAKQFRTMKQWSHAFYDGCFFEFIRKQHNINLLSEREFLEANREKLIKAGCKEIPSAPTEAFDFSKITVNQIVDTNTAISN